MLGHAPIAGATIASIGSAFFDPAPSVSLGISLLSPDPPILTPAAPSVPLGFATVPIFDGLSVYWGFTSTAPAPAIFLPGGSPNRIYRCKIAIEGGEAYTVAPVNYQSTWRYSLSTYLSVTLAALPDAAVDAITAALTSDPVVDVTLTLQAGWHQHGRPEDDFYADQMTVNLSAIRIDTGSTSRSISLEGYRVAASETPKTYSLGAAEYIRSGAGGTAWRGKIDTNVRPGDRVTLTDLGASVVIGSINYVVDVDRATMEVGELTDADLLATLPW